VRKINAHKAVVIAASITALAGLTTALINRFAPSEPTAEAAHSATQDVVEYLNHDIDVLERRIEFLERTLINERRRKKAKPRKRPKMPSLKDIQQRGR